MFLDKYIRISNFWILEFFILVNMSFLAIDILLAHSINSFKHRIEWFPVIFSIIATLLHGFILLRGYKKEQIYVKRSTTIKLIAIISFIVGILGVYFHLESSFFKYQTMKNLVYSAPFVAPLAYIALGLLIFANRIEKISHIYTAKIILLISFFGFLGNFVLSILDHAQNGFFHKTEMIPVISSMIVLAFLLPVCFGLFDRKQIYLCNIALLLQIVTGILGFYFHLNANLNGKSSSMWDNFVFGAPIFAPFLFINLSLLTFIGFRFMFEVQKEKY